MLHFPLQSERVELRPFEAGDQDAMQQVFGDAKVMTYLGSGEPIDANTTAKWLSEYQEHQRIYGVAFWAVVERATDLVIGDAGFEFRISNDDISCELGYTLGLQWWGQGYATEVASLCLEAIFADFGVNEVTAIADVNNSASIRVLEKLGFTQTGERQDHNRPHAEYRLTAAEWAQRTGREAVQPSAPIVAEKDNVARLLHLVEHPNSDVRDSLARALPSAAGYENREDVVSALVQLTDDFSEESRNWACFGLGQLRADTREVRDALMKRIDDNHDETRGEALLALAQLADERVVEPLRRRLSSETVWTLEIEAAAAIADPLLYEKLAEVERWWKDDEDLEKLQYALHRCHPNARDEAKSFEERLLAELGSSTAVRIAGNYPLSVLITEIDGKRVDEWALWEDRDPLTNVDVDDAAKHWQFNIDESIVELDRP